MTGACLALAEQLQTYDVMPIGLNASRFLISKMSIEFKNSSYELRIEELGEIVCFDRRTDPQLVEVLLDTYDGVQGIANRLKSNIEKGIPLKYTHTHNMPTKYGQDVGQDMTVIDQEDRKEVFGENIIPPPRSLTILEIVWDTIVEDPILKILIVGAVIVLSLGTATCPSEGWIEGLAIVIAVFIVLSVTAGNDWSKDRKFKKLMLLQTDKRCRVIRGGVKNEISSWDILVGDVVELVVGDEVPADGIFITGNRLIIDESPLTGETQPMKKSTEMPFLFSGCQVSEGSGLMLVTAVGVQSSGGKIQELLNASQDEMTPLQEKLKDVAILIGKVGVAAGVITFIGLAVRWGIDISNSTPVASTACNASSGGTSILDRLASIVEDFVIAITVIVVAVPEGLPLAVTLALSLSMFKMMRDNCFVRHLDASETMGQATTVCTDKTGTLTYNRMSVVRIMVGDRIYKGEGSGDKDAMPFSQKTFANDVRTVLTDGICINSNCFIKNEELLDEPGVLPIFVGSATEGALLVFARKIGVNYKTVRQRLKVVENGVWSFSADKKRMSTLIEHNNHYRLYTKGASEIILSLCTKALNSETMEVAPITANEISIISKNIKAWASEGLRTFALAYKDVTTKYDSSIDDNIDSDLVFVALIAIKDPLRKEIPGAVAMCQKAGLVIRMVTGDNILTATKIAKECNIFHGDGVALEGPVFRAMSDEEKLAVVPKLQVMARCSPADKFELVTLLKSLGEVVAVTGDGTNDAPALKAADIGFSMGISGTQIAMNASDIVLLDDNFASIVQAIRWGRNVLCTIRKFLQFQLGINLAAVIVTFLGSVITGSSPLSTVQLLWINLIMDSFGAIALASDEPDANILDEAPQRKQDPMLTGGMKEYILLQTVYQTIVLMFLIIWGDTVIPNLRTDLADLTGFPTVRTKTLVFNTFILMQLSNLVCARNINGELNMFIGFFKNKYFLMILTVIILVQLFAVCIAYSLFNCVPLSLTEWGVCFIFMGINIPVVFIERIFSKLYHVIMKRKRQRKVLVEKADKQSYTAILHSERDYTGPEHVINMPATNLPDIRTAPRMMPLVD
ncbi:Calcium-transporting ATPase 10, plasma membrane-type [Boothiomyces sp. JEL0866]|nr:Calcium-transporting ATPase 10, plasma membrane-type [Boothiomyces sp. JEL0866]